MKRFDIVDQAQAIRNSMNTVTANLTDEEALAVANLYEHWKVGIKVVEFQRLFNEYDQKLYKVNKGHGHTTQADWRPDLAPALFTVIDVSHAGTIDDPIPASRGMEYTYGLYYLDPEDGNIYLCKRGEETGTVVLQYLPHELIGHYFEGV